MVDMVTLGWQDLRDKITAAPGIESLVRVYEPDDMVDIQKNLKPPYIGIAYTGASPSGDDDRGLSSVLEFRLYIAIKGDSVKCAPVKESESNLESLTGFLKAVRNAITDTEAPNRHKWKFAGEAPYEANEKLIGYVQVWTFVAPMI